MITRDRVSADAEGAAEALRAVLGAPQTPAARAPFAPMVAAAQTLVAPGTWAAAWAEGQVMPLEQAMAYALAETARLP